MKNVPLRLSTFLQPARAAAVLMPLCAALLLGGCSSGKELVKPAELTKINNQSPPKVLWTASAGSAQDSHLKRLAPVEAGGRVFAADPEGDVYAYDLKTGKRLWSQSLDVPLSVGAGASDKMVAVGTAKGDVIALAADSGKVLWRSQLSTSVDAAPSIGFDGVAVRTKDGAVTLLKASDGSQIWSITHDEPSLTLQGQSRALLFPDAVAVGFDDGKLAVLSRDDGRTLWQVPVAQPSGRTDIDRMVDIDATPIFAHGVFYVASYQGRIAAISAQGGRILWSRKFSSYSDITADANAIYATDADGTVWALDRRTGEPLWRQPALAHRGVTGPVLDNGKLVVGDFEGYLSVMDPKTGALIGRTRLDGAVVDPMRVADGKIMATTRDGDLAVFTLP